MKMPNFKPTKWKLIHCENCNITDTRVRGYCKRENHTLHERDNIPFFVMDMEFSWVGSKWSGLKSQSMVKDFSISASKLEKLIMGCGIQAGGKVHNKWWMYAKVGSSLSLTVVDEPTT